MSLQVGSERRSPRGMPVLGAVVTTPPSSLYDEGFVTWLRDYFLPRARLRAHFYLLDGDE